MGCVYNFGHFIYIYNPLFFFFFLTVLRRQQIIENEINGIIIGTCDDISFVKWIAMDCEPVMG